MLCKLLDVSRSGCYAAVKRPESSRSRNDLALLARIEEMHEEHKHRAGVIKTWKQLLNEGRDCGRNKVARLRRQSGIETKRVIRFRKKIHSQRREPAAADLLQRHFLQSKPNRVWVGDMTHVHTRKGPLHLAVKIDLCTHRVVGWATSTSQTAELAVRALQAGLESAKPGPGLICHTDQGSPYASKLYRDHLQQRAMKPSMSRKGNCHDNAVAESFFSNLKNELTHDERFDDHAQAEAAIAEYIDVYYNRQRLHQTLGYRTPAQVDLMHRCC
jgi:putative transposase